MCLFISYSRFNFGGDFIVYYQQYILATDNSFLKYLLLAHSDVLFDLTVYAFAKIGLDFSIFLCLITLFQLLVLNHTVIRHFPDVKLKALIFCMYFIIFESYFLSMVAIRQTISGAILMLGIYYSLERRIVLSLLMILLAAGFHKAVILFLPIIFLGSVKIKNIHYVVVFLVVLIATIIPNSFYIKVFQFIGLGEYNTYFEKIVEYRGGTTYLLRIVLFIIVFAVGIRIRGIRMRMEKRIVQYYFFLFFIYVGITLFGAKVAYADRLADYLVLVLPISLTYAYLIVKGNYKLLLICFLLLNSFFSVFLRKNSYFYQEYRVIYNSNFTELESINIEVYRKSKNKQF